MKSDIPRLMQERQLDAIVLSGSTGTSTDLSYMVNGVTLEGALYVQRRDTPPVLFSSPLEREVAAASGHQVRLWSEYDLREYLKKHHNDRTAAWVAIFSDVLAGLGVSGRVGFYGMADQGYSYLFLSALAAANPHIEIVGEPKPNLFNHARQTKDAAELERMRRVARRTTEVIDSVIAYMQAHAVRDETLVRPDGSPLTIADVKAHMRLEMARRSLVEDHETIFSQGRDAGIGHNTGTLDMPLRLGQAIVFDIFPRDRETGYFHDVTRTLFLGYAPEMLALRWQQVKTVFDAVLADLRVGELCSHYQHMTCDYFEDLGYPTTRSDPKTQEGYNHSLGHGLGLDIHEEPRLSHMPDDTTRLQPGHVFSVEPGLYYPEQGWGIRIEDTVAFDEHGNLVNLTDYPYDMVIPMS